jgi:hypothetical protein
MDIHIWYTLLSALVGGVMGARDRLGEVYCALLFPGPIHGFKFYQLRTLLIA